MQAEVRTSFFIAVLPPDVIVDTQQSQFLYVLLETVY